MLVELLGVNEVLEAGLAAHGVGVDAVAKVVAVLWRDNTVEAARVVDDGQGGTMAARRRW